MYKRAGRSHLVMLVAAAGLMLALSACGGGNDETGPTPPAPPDPPVTTTIFSQGYSVGAGAGPATPAIGFQDVSVPNTGQVVVTFDWTFTSSDIDLVVTPPSCSSGVAAYDNQCTVHGSDRSYTKPARVSFTALSPGVIRIWVYNFATVPESGVLNVTLTH
jgi:hypothetical protein